MQTTATKKEKALTYLCAFFLPVLLALAAFAVMKIYPFGDKTLLIVDMHNEYIDYLSQLNETVRSSGSFLRSWNMGLGLNMLGLIAFYTSSPFNLLILLLPLKWITEAVFAVTLLKLGLCGLLFAVYARNTFPKINRVFHVIFAVAYALCAYNIAYSSNIMWLDGVAFLPLVLMGVEKLLRENRARLLLLSLVYVFFTSYYIGYMIGVFAFLYFTAVWLLEPAGRRDYFIKLGKLIGSAALAAGCCAFLLLPAFLNLKNGQVELWNIPFAPELIHTFVSLSAKLLPGSFDTLTDIGMPNLYCTVLAAALTVLFFCAKAIPKREKQVFGGLLLFLFLSLSCVFLDLAWHAFEDPTWFPARYSFVFSFLLLYLSMRCVTLLSNISKGEVIAASAVCVLLFVEIGVNRFHFAGLKQVLAGTALVLAYAVILLVLRSGKRESMAALMIVLVCMETFGSAAAAIIDMDWQFEYRSRTDYRAFMESYGAAVNEVFALDAGAYRTEIVGQRGPNGGMALGYNGISHYSTTTDQALNYFLRDLGYNVGTINELRFAPTTPLTNGLLGIRYVVSPRALGDAYQLKRSVGELGIYQNMAAWPLAYWAPQTALRFSGNASEGPFMLQNEWLRALTGDDAAALMPLAVSNETLTNIEKVQGKDHIEYTRQIKDKDAAIEFDVMVPAGREAFAYFPVYDRKYSATEVFVNGILYGKETAYRNNTVIPLGGEGGKKIKIVLSGDRVRISNAYFAALDLEIAKSAAEKAAAHAVDFEVFRDTFVSGAVTAPEDGLIATSFPSDSGWKIFVDGKRVEQEKMAGVFLAFHVEKGKHKIEMRYTPPGLLPGVWISLLTVAGIAAFGLWRAKRHAP